jgi:hypothetical protein
MCLSRVVSLGSEFEIVEVKLMKTDYILSSFE